MNLNSKEVEQRDSEIRRHWDAEGTFFEHKGDILSLLSRKKVFFSDSRCQMQLKEVQVRSMNCSGLLLTASCRSGVGLVLQEMLFVEANQV